MKKLPIALSLLLTLGSSAQTKMSQVFRQMPDEVMPYLSENNRLDLIDFADSNMKAEVHNLLEGRSELKKITDDYALLSLNEATQVEMRLLDVSTAVDSSMNILCMVSTYGTSLRDSKVDFYSVKWRKLDSSQWVTLPLQPFTAALDEKQPLLTVTPLSNLDAEMLNEQKEGDKLSTVLKWNGEKFN